MTLRVGWRYPRVWDCILTNTQPSLWALAVVIMKPTYCGGTTQMLVVVHESRFRLYKMKGIVHVLYVVGLHV